MNELILTEAKLEAAICELKITICTICKWSQSVKINVLISTWQVLNKLCN